MKTTINRPQGIITIESHESGADRPGETLVTLYAIAIDSTEFHDDVSTDNPGLYHEKGALQGNSGLLDWVFVQGACGDAL